DSARVLRHAARHGVQYVNHTFTTQLALSASLQPFAGSAADWLCEYPVEATPLASGLTRDAITVGSAGELRAPEAPGLGIDPDLDAVRPYLLEVEIAVGGRVLYRTPDLVA
ncbi:MAG TPA: enolase C-terminal domain-like protein, partial [Acidimicrobiales bacterium]|nr:enolase C-terminal domain-like protein [Acidimicrobiales bacterium]